MGSFGPEFLHVMRKEYLPLVQTLTETSQHKNVFCPRDIGARYTMKQTEQAEPTVREAVLAAVDAAPSTPLMRESQKWLNQLVRDLNSTRDRFREARIEFAKGKEITLLGAEAYSLVKLGADQQNAYRRHAELAKLVNELPREIAKLEEAARLQTTVTQHYAERVAEEVSRCIRPLHDRIVRNIDQAMLALSTASQAELDLLAALTDGGVRRAPTIQPVALTGFNTSAESKHYAWREFARNNGYSNVVELPTANRHIRRAS
jgi:transcriptional regulator of acetoin/glycerol metabolism